VIAPLDFSYQQPEVTPQVVDPEEAITTSSTLGLGSNHVESAVKK